MVVCEPGCGSRAEAVVKFCREKLLRLERRAKEVRSRDAREYAASWPKVVQTLVVLMMLLMTVPSADSETVLREIGSYQKEIGQYARNCLERMKA